MLNLCKISKWLIKMNSKISRSNLTLLILSSTLLRKSKSLLEEQELIKRKNSLKKNLSSNRSRLRRTFALKILKLIRPLKSLKKDARAISDSSMNSLVRSMLSTISLLK